MTKTNKQKTNWLVGAVLFAGFLISFFLDLTGVSLHQWLGIAVGLLAGYHLITHWEWVEAVTQRFFGRTPKGRTSNQARLYYLVDAALSISFGLILATGLMISTWFSLSLENYAAWKNLHVLVSIVTLPLIVVKIGIHWRWIVRTARRHIFRPSIPERQKQPAKPLVAPVTTERREFLKLMGVVGAAALVAMLSGLDGAIDALANTTGQADQEDSTSSALTSSSSQKTDSLGSSAPDASGSSGSCIVSCNRGCSYPGHCRRYVDTNGNNRCDLGECA